MIGLGFLRILVGNCAFLGEFLFDFVVSTLIVIDHLELNCGFVARILL